VKASPIDTARLATDLRQAGKRAFVFIGSGVNYALSLYGAAKINEVLGAKAEAVCPEQLGHAKLFTIDKEHDIIVCISSGHDRAMETHELLAKKGFRGSVIIIPKGRSMNRSLGIAVYLQRLALGIAKKRRMPECAFLANKRRLDLSNRLIY
jgi:glucosamine 6-phosphate synthetase-like amidotransferase/phosphosugar isomerase protein